MKDFPELDFPLKDGDLERDMLWHAIHANDTPAPPK